MQKQEACLIMFENAMKSEATRETYTYYLNRFCKETDLSPERIITLGNSNPKELAERLIVFLAGYKEQEKHGKISASSIQGFYKAVKLLCVMNDVVLNWSKISRLLPSAKKGEDRAIDIDEIKQLLKYAYLRSKALVLTMASSGIRVGSIPALKVKHLKPIQEDGKIVAASLQVYARDKEEYITFVTEEAYEALYEYLEYRKRHGEIIDGNSPLFRDKFRSEAGDPKPFERDGIRATIHRLLKKSGVRKVGNGVKRFEFQADHGFRKFFKTRCEQTMKPINVETLMGYSTGVAGRYYRPREGELLEDYKKAIPLLLIEQQVPDEANKKLEEKYTNQANEIEGLKSNMVRMEKHYGLVIDIIGEKSRLEAMLQLGKISKKQYEAEMRRVERELHENLIKSKLVQKPMDSIRHER